MSSLASLVPLGGSIKRACVNTGYRLRHVKQHAVIGPNVELSEVVLGAYVNVSHHVQISGSSLGRRTSVGRYTKIRNADIGSYCSISWDVTIGATSHPMDHPATHAFWYRKQFGIVEENAVLDEEKVLIGNDVWIGCAAVILPGVTIGDGAVIGANSVVTKNIDPYSVVAGCPAKVMKKRFDEDLCKEVSLLRWWDWPDERIREATRFFERPLSRDTLRSLRESEGSR